MMATTTATSSKRIAMLKVLNPFHIWALGVGIVLVGEFMGRFSHRHCRGADSAIAGCRVQCPS